MKKIYFSALVLGLTSFAGNAQNALQKFDNSVLSNETVSVNNHSNYAPKALGTEIWRDDFNNNANWTASVVTNPTGGSAPAGFGWNIGTATASWWANFATNINSSSGGGFAEVNNGNYYNNTQEINLTYYMTSVVLDIPTLSGGSDDVVLSFEQFGALFNDAQTVEITTDGTNYTEIFSNAGRTVYVGNNPSAVYANPEKISINISPFIDGNASTVQLRFKWTSAFAGQSDLGAWTTFGWFIDDVTIETVADNDLTVTEPVWGTQGIYYYQIPSTQVAPIDFSAIVTNNGSATQTNTTLDVNITGAGTYSASSAPQDFVFLETDTLEVAPYTPAALGTYNVAWAVTQNEVEDYPVDNGIPNFAFQVTDHTYAVDNGVQDASMNNSGDGFIIGNLFDIWADQSAYGIDVYINSNSVVGSTIQGTIATFDGTQATFADAVSNQVGFTDYHEIAAGDLGSFITLPLLSASPLNNVDLTYYVSINSDGDGGASNGAVIGYAGPVQVGVCVYSPDAGANFYRTNGTPMVRLNFDETLNVTENEMVSGLSIYPNPATDNISVDFNLANASDVTIEVVDAAGKVAIAKTLSSQAAGQANVSFETSALNSGVYFVNISTEAGKATQKFIKK